MSFCVVAEGIRPSPFLKERDSVRTVYQAVLSDEFDGVSLDAEKWDLEIPSWGDWSWNSKNIYQGSGTLKVCLSFDPHMRDGKELYYTSGLIRSRTPSVKYGYFEARIRAPSRTWGYVPHFGPLIMTKQSTRRLIL